MAAPCKAPAPTARAQADRIHHLLHPHTICFAGCQSCTGMSPKQGQQSHQFFPVKEFCISYKLLTALQERISAMKYKGCIVPSSSSWLFTLLLKRKRHWRKCGVWLENREKEGNWIPHGEEKYKTTVQNLDLIMHEIAFDIAHRYGSRILWNQGTSFTFECFFHFSIPAICMEHSSRDQTEIHRVVQYSLLSRANITLFLIWSMFVVQNWNIFEYSHAWCVCFVCLVVFW